VPEHVRRTKVLTLREQTVYCCACFASEYQLGEKDFCAGSALSASLLQTGGAPILSDVAHCGDALALSSNFNPIIAFLPEVVAQFAAQLGS
jgi:hypothetical protein